ncbi:MAG: SMC-Scp complex subunit ScpB [Gemmatimonadetes bacterium]|nr:SMC-Scp complex subunit ScpB [Gemmatimonadota bacterium]
MNHLTKLLEAALFSAAHALSIRDLKGLDPDASAADIEQGLAGLREHYEAHDHGFELVELADGYQLVTRAEFAEAIVQARIARRPRKLSTAALETLAIIAYRQPVGRAEIEEIRGVAADGVLKSLQERGLIDVTGRGEGLGRPLLYGTTASFLEMIGLGEVAELPKLDQLSVALRPMGAQPGLTLPSPDEEEAEEFASDAGELETPELPETVPEDAPREAGALADGPGPDGLAEVQGGDPPEQP